jgi:hypothetical protein
MSYGMRTLPTRNLHDVSGETRPMRRRAVIDEIFAEDCVFHGREEIDRVAGGIKATHPDFRYWTALHSRNELQRAGERRTRN